MRVGTRCSLICSSCYAEDHPHACGDKLASAFQSIFFLGSSPCVWGQEDCGNCRYGHVRIIPMRVGTSFALNDTDVVNRDHPHACGDKSIA